MFDATSRYYTIPIVTIEVTDSEGQPRKIRYIRRRFIPSSQGANTLVEHTVVQGERLDTITARYLGDPLQFWRVCDVNDVLTPDELTEIGHVITIAVPHI
jgi:hypothetical protein